MPIFYVHQTALDFWRWHARTNRGRTSATRLRAIPRGCESVSSIRLEAVPFARPDSDIHVAVADCPSMRNVKHLRCHHMGGQLPSGTFRRISDGVYVTSPESTFIQLARDMDFLSLVQLGFEWCGSYSLDSDDTLGFCSTMPLMTKAGLSARVAASGSFAGVKKARRALRYLTVGSASPRETVVCMLLTLPRGLGGYGLPAPALNKRIMVDRGPLDRHEFFADMFWEQAHLVLEYDSDEWHTGKEKISRDSKRRNILSDKSLDVITLTNEELKHVDDLDRIARRISRRTGTRLRIQSGDYGAAKMNLRRALIFRPDEATH